MSFLDICIGLFLCFSLRLRLHLGCLKFLRTLEGLYIVSSGLALAPNAIGLTRDVCAVNNTQPHKKLTLIGLVCS